MEKSLSRLPVIRSTQKIISLLAYALFFGGIMGGFTLQLCAQTAAASFKGGSGVEKPDQYPGAAGDGWAGAWKVHKSPEVDILASAESSGTDSWLAFEMRTVSQPKEYSNGAVVRVYENADRPHVIHFKIRVDKMGGNTIGIFGGRNPQSNFTSDSTWSIRASGKDSNSWKWAAYNGGGDGGKFDGKLLQEIGGWGKGMPVASGKVYEFTITNHPQQGTYDVTVANEGQTVKLSGLKYRAAQTDWAQSKAGLAFQGQQKRAEDVLAFVIPEIRIEPLSGN